MRHLALALLCCAAMLAPAASPAVTLRPGDIVVAVPWQNYPAPIMTLDAATLDTTLVSYGPHVWNPGGIAVDRTGRILIAEPTVGIVHVDATSMSQQVLTAAGALGGPPAGICLGPDGEMYVTVGGAAPGVVRVSPEGSSVTTVSSGDHITDPGNLARGPDGQLYVTERSQPHNQSNPYGPNWHGSIVRVDPSTGGQTVIASDSLFLGPFDIAFVTQDKVWSLQKGWISGRLGCFIETRISDGKSTVATTSHNYCRSQSIAVADDGTVYVGDCQTYGPDCYNRFIARLPAGPTKWYVSGRMTAVPQNIVPVRQGSWGKLKTIYR